MSEEMMINDPESFSLRLAKLREAKGLSARLMSLDMGQNKNYISYIESGRSYPSMKMFFEICDYLHITPEEFFNPNYKNPVDNESISKLIHRLSPYQSELFLQLANEILCPGHHNSTISKTTAGKR